MILVTGGTGLVGAHLLYHLAIKEDKIRAIFRNPDKISKTKHVFSYFTQDVDALFNKIEWVEADIIDIPKLTKAFKDVTKVYHCAALVSFDPNDYHDLRKSNIEGTANVVNQCIENKIQKLCYVSSIAAIGKTKNDGFITEENYWNPEDDNSVYAISKYGAEMEVWRGTQEGIEAVIVNPGIILGGGFWKYGSGSLFRIIHRGLNYYTKGIVGFVDVEDVVKGMIQLMKSDISNERYIMIAENLSFEEFFKKVANSLDVKPPKKEIKNWMLQVAWRLDWAKQKLTQKRRKLTKQTAASLLSDRSYSSDKIKTDLNFQFKPIERSIEESSRLFLKDFQD